VKAHTHIFTGPHPEVLADGTPVAIGALVTPDPDDPHDAAIIARGWLTPVELKPERRTRSEEKS
jgi:hypothetical protein